MTAMHSARVLVNMCLRPLGLELVRAGSHDGAVHAYIPARKTMAAARHAGLSVGDYLDQTYAEPGATARTVESMLELSGLSAPVNTVCEIGPGSGRYLEAVAAALHPKTYEIYEPAKDCARHLPDLPSVITRDSDGRSLPATATGSVDLVHAQKVFVYLDFATLVGYLVEMARVVRVGGCVAFDVVTEPCLDDTTVATWVSHGSFFRPVPRAWLIEFLQHRGLTYLGHHVAPLPPGCTELLVFRRTEEYASDT
jgi:hypothetical protein